MGFGARNTSKMRAFDFVLLFFSFVYALALTHLLMAAARMIRHRRKVVFSPPHALWMLVALFLVIGNWISLWDFHGMAKITAAAIAGGFAFSVLVYLDCALVSPDFDKDEIIDLREFHDRQGTTYIGAMLATEIMSVILNLAVASGMGIQNWGNENALVFAMLVPTVAALAMRKPWVQVAAPLVLAGLLLAFIFVYYPILQ